MGRFFLDEPSCECVAGVFAKRFIFIVLHVEVHDARKCVPRSSIWLVEKSFRVNVLTEPSIMPIQVLPLLPLCSGIYEGSRWL